MFRVFSIQQGGLKGYKNGRKSVIPPDPEDADLGFKPVQLISNIDDFFVHILGSSINKYKNAPVGKNYFGSYFKKTLSNGGLSTDLVPHSIRT